MLTMGPPFFPLIFSLSSNLLHPLSVWVITKCCHFSISTPYRNQLCCHQKRKKIFIVETSDSLRPAFYSYSLWPAKSLEVLLLLEMTSQFRKEHHYSEDGCLEAFGQFKFTLNTMASKKAVTLGNFLLLVCLFLALWLTFSSTFTWLLFSTFHYFHTSHLFSFKTYVLFK